MKPKDKEPLEAPLSGGKELMDLDLNDDKLFDDIEIPAPEKSSLDINVMKCRNQRKRKRNTVCEDLTNNNTVRLEAPLSDGMEMMFDSCS